MFKSKKKVIDTTRPPLQVLNYYDDGKLVMSKKDEKLVIESIKVRKLKEIELSEIFQSIIYQYKIQLQIR